MNMQRSKAGKYSIIAMVVLAMAGFMTASAFANEGCQHGHWNQEKRAEFFEKRQAELHDKLQLTQTQEADWNTFIEKVRPGEHAARPSREDMEKLSVPERMEQRLAVRQEMLKRMEARVQATKEFYSHLTTEQRQIFDTSFQHHHAQDRG